MTLILLDSCSQTQVVKRQEEVVVRVDTTISVRIPERTVTYDNATYPTTFATVVVPESMVFEERDSTTGALVRRVKFDATKKSVTIVDMPKDIKKDVTIFTTATIVNDTLLVKPSFVKEATDLTWAISLLVALVGLISGLALYFFKRRNKKAEAVI